MPSFISVKQNALRLNEGQSTVRDYLEAFNGSHLSFGGSWTVEAWVATTDDDGQFNRILRMPSGSLQTYSLIVQNGQVKLVAGSTIITGIDIADGEYHLISGVYDSGLNDLILYVDGVEVARNNNVPAPPVSSENLFIGTANNSLSNQFFDGSIAEVRIWNTARSQGQIIDSAVELDAAAAGLNFAMAVSGGSPVDFTSSTKFSTVGQPQAEVAFFARAGEVDALDLQDFMGGDVQINGDPGDDAVYTLSSPNGTFFLNETSGVTILTENGTSVVSFKVGQDTILSVGGPGKLAPPTNEDIVDAVLSNTEFRPDDGFTGNTTVTFSIVGPGVDESVEFPMIVVPNNSIVTTALDVVDATDGLLSLREAVMLVNDGVTDETITFDPTVFNGELQDVIRLTSGDIFIADNVRINGDLNDDGTPDVVISGDAFGDDITDVNGITDVAASLVGSDRLDDNGRIFTSLSTTIYLNGLTITGGRTTGDGGGSYNNFFFAGGAIHSRYANVFIDDSVLSGNSTTGAYAGGGAVFAYGGLTLTNTLVTGNSTAGDDAIGGGVMTKWGQLWLENSQIASNSTTGSNADGGGAATYDADIYAIESSIANNQSAGAGGGVAANGSVYFVSSTVNGNTAAGYGGGIEADGQIALVNATISGNSSTGGGGLYTSYNAYVTASTISGNSTTGSGGYGGGVNVLGSLSLTDSIVLGNNARQAGADEIQAFGGYQFYGYNLVGRDSAAFDAGLHNYVGNAAPGLVFDSVFNNFGTGAGVLGFNGGEVLTIALRPNASNPAIDAAYSSLPGDNFDLDHDGNNGEVIPVDARGDGFLRGLGLDGSIDLYSSNVRDLGAFEAQGAVGLVVTTAADTVDFLDGYVSLREAVIFANQDSSGYSQTITFDPTVFNGQPADIIRLTEGEIEITAEFLTIDGDLNDDGTPDVVITGDALGNDIANTKGITWVQASLAGANRLTDNSGIFSHNNYSGHLYLYGLTLTGGRQGDSHGGGAVFGVNSVSIVDSLIAGNSTSHDDGKGGGVSAYGSLTITDSTISGNTTGTTTGTSGQTAKGGGAYSGGSLKVTGSTITNNHTVGYSANGGGIATYSNITITDSTIGGNSTQGDVADGGGVFTSNELTIINSTIDGNSTSGNGSAQGGGVHSSSKTTIVGSTISDNSTTGTSGRGGGVYSDSILTLVSSTVSGNSTANSDAGGGGIFTNSTATLTNVTISGNSTTGSNSTGGGIHASSLNLYNSTVTGNATTGSNSTGGGVFASSYIRDSIVLGNTTTYAGIGGDEISGSYSFGGYNLIGQNMAAFDTTFYSNVANAPAGLVFDSVFNNRGVGAGVLADNGGLVETVALRAAPGNVAIDAGTHSLPSDSQDLDNDGNFGEPIPFDARGPGYARSINGNGTNSHDLGAFEAQPPNPSLVVNTAQDTVNAFDNFTSLREAVGFVNAGVLEGTITFAPGIFNGQLNDVIRLTQGEIEITTAMSIDGDLNDDGTPDVVISGDANGDDFNVDANGLTILHAGFVPNLDDNSRIFNISNSNAHTELTGLTLTGGYTYDDGSNYAGGAIKTRAELTITDSVVTGNSTSGSSARGGAIHATFTGDLIIHNSLIDNNGTFTSSGGGDGGAIFSYGNVSVYDSTVSNNFVLGAGADGAGINTRGNLLVMRSTISGNDNNGSGGASGGGLYGHYGGSLTIVSSTISDNVVHQSSGKGGGVAAKSDLLVINSTFNGNKTFGSSGHGGALYIYDNSGSNETARIYNSTFSGNSVFGSNAEAGGIWVRDSPLFVSNSIILGNYARYGYAGDQEVKTSSTSLNFEGDNIVGQMPYAFNTNSYFNVSNGNPFQVFQDLEVNGFWTAGKLADNGGPVQTIALRQTEDNPAINGGIDSALPPDFFDLNNNGNVSEALPFDARGEARLSSKVDLGAFELQLTQSLVVDTALDVVDAFDGVTSLREAISYINSDTLSGTITFDAAVFNGEAQDIIRLSNGHLQLDRAISIDGDINGDGTPDVVISGDRDGNDITDAQGITNVELSRSTGSYGGLLRDNTRLIFEIGSYSYMKALDNNGAGHELYQGTQLNGLILTGGYGVKTSGGAIRNFAELTITDSVIAGNTASNRGGGIYNSLENLTLENTTIHGNSTLGTHADGGGVHSYGAVTLLNSTVSDNQTHSYGAHGGGIYSTTSITSIGSTISGNRTGGDDADGGGLWAFDLQLINSTLHGNATGGDNSKGGGAHGFNVTLVNSTVSGNYTQGFGSYGGGFYAADDVYMTNSIVLGNTTIFNGVNDDEFGADGAMDFYGQNIVGSNFVAFNAAPHANVINGNPGLVFKNIAANNGVFGGRLGDNGGAVETVALREIGTNPALDSGQHTALLGLGLDESAYGLDFNNNGKTTDILTIAADLPFDSRDVAFGRLFGKGIDLGAFELESAGPIQGTAGNDLLFGGSKGDVINGAAGNDTMHGGPGGDVLNGGGGLNKASYEYATLGLVADLVVTASNTRDAAGDSYIFVNDLIGSSHADKLWGNFNANMIFAGGGDDIVVGRSGNDTLFGQNGDDILNGGIGQDVLNGGAGSNTASYDMAGSALLVDLFVPGKNTGEAIGDTYIQIQNLTGSGFADELWGTFGDNVLNGGGGGDFLRGRAGNDTLNGGPGNDRLDGGDGADALRGGAGIDLAYYLSSSVGLTVDLQNPGVNTGAAAGDTYANIQNLLGSLYDDTLYGTAGANVITGSSGNDILFGRGGNDTLQGQGGDDILDGGAGGDLLQGGSGNDTASYGSATAGVTADMIVLAINTGDAAGDVYSGIRNLRGSSYDDLLKGSFAHNRLEGGAGNDTLFGRGGGDVHNGGAGNDTFTFLNNFGAAVIEDFDEFSSAEKIDLSMVTNITDYADLVSNHLSQSGAHAVITDGAATITIQNTLIANLDNGDFLF